MAVLLVGEIAMGQVQPTKPLWLGVDTAGSYHGMRQGCQPWEVEAFWGVLDQLGANFVNLHEMLITHAGEQNAALLADYYRRRDQAVRDHDMHYTVSIEHPNFVASAEVTPGVNEYAHSEDRHFYLIRPEWYQLVLPPKQPDPRLLTVIYDEPAHMQLSNNKYSDFPRDDFDQPFLVNTHGLPLEVAYEKLVAECLRIRQNHYGDQVTLNTEQVWPDLFHIFARAGWNVGPKFLKEHLTPVVASIALGAALQYQENDIQFWVCTDLWGVLGYPGHSCEALRSALLMAYWLGAEGIYVENLDYPGMVGAELTAGPTGGHPDATPGGSLVVWQDRDNWTLTRYGEVVRDFYNDYIPAHTRTIDWRTFEPEVAIIRFPDGGWGQYDAGTEPFPHPEAPSRNRLLGNRDLPLDERAGEWLEVWSILTHGVSKPGAISYNNPLVYPEQQDFFVPVSNVAVFDHTVTGPVLDTVKCFVVCGHALSPETWQDLQQRVAQGGCTALISKHLLPPGTDPQELVGDWLVVENFSAPEVRSKLEPFLGPSDVARYCFGGQQVEFWRGERPDAIRVEITSTQQ